LYEYHNEDWYKQFPDDKYHIKYSDEALELFKQAYKSIKEAQVYMTRIDYLLSGDDGEESFISRTKDELSKLQEYEESCSRENDE